MMSGGMRMALFGKKNYIVYTGLTALVRDNCVETVLVGGNTERHDPVVRKAPVYRIGGIPCVVQPAGPKRIVISPVSAYRLGDDGILTGCKMSRAMSAAERKMFREAANG